jgi:hypothetical protein
MSTLVSRRLHAPADFRGVFDDMYRRGFTDGLPVIPPTEDAVWAMLDYARLEPDHVIAILPPDDAPATAEKVAINAVMAGCLPEYLPVLAAALAAAVEPKFNLLAIQTTTNPAGPVMVVNGPIRHAIELNCGRGCLGPGWRANATIGRALRLVLVNVGGCPPGKIDKAIHGMPGKFTFCFGELEEESPWPPLHVERGFAPEQSTVTLFGGQGTQNVLGMFRTPQNLVHVLADGMRCYGYNGYLRGTGSPLIVLSPGHARIFADHGWDKQRIKRELFERAQIPRSHIPDEQQITRPVYADYAPGEMCLPCRGPDEIHIVVAGGPEGYHMVYIPSFSHVEASTAPIDLPTRSTP